MQVKSLLFNCFKIIILFLVFPFIMKSQIANYVTNGGFELRYNCNQPDDLGKAKGWRTIDSISYGNSAYCSTCYSTVPYTPVGFQYPRSGDAFAGADALCQPTFCATWNSRGYLRNRLKANLQNGKTYCVKFYVNVTNDCSYGIDGFGAHFSDNSLDTIILLNSALTFLIPQVSNQNSNIITDTLNWTLITGTFVANGTEKNVVIGNFKAMP